MGCDIHSYVEAKDLYGSWEKVDGAFEWDDFDKEHMGKKGKRSAPFDWRSYAMFGFLADVRNYSEIRPIASPRGAPGDMSPEVSVEYERWEGDAHSASWLTADELLKFDYSKTFADMRVTREVAPGLTSGAARALPGEETEKTIREFLGPAFFEDLEALKKLGDPTKIRIVFWFDN